jgi:hypothetical protein
VIRRGSVLLECLVALAIFVGVASTVYSLIIGAAGSVERTARIERAADLARSALSKIEAGIETPESLNGPVESWRDDSDGTFDDVAVLTPWVLEISTEPSEFEGLVMVTARAECYDPPGSDRLVTSFELKQLIALGSTSSETPRNSRPIDATRTRPESAIDRRIEERNSRRSRREAEQEAPLDP